MNQGKKLGCYRSSLGCQRNPRVFDQFDEKMLEKDKNATRQALRLVAILLVPVVGFLSLTLVDLSVSLKDYHMAHAAEVAFNNTLAIAKLVSSLQVERGTTAIFISSNKTSTNVMARLTDARDKTNKDIYAVEVWPTSQSMIEPIRNRRVLRGTIETHRRSVIYTDVSIEMNIAFYTNITLALLRVMTANIVLPNRGDNWKSFVAFDAILHAGDYIGVQRALGASYFAACHMSDSNLAWFMKLEEESSTNMDQVFYYNTVASKSYKDGMARMSKLAAQLKTLKHQVTNESYIPLCKRWSTTDRVRHGIYFFGNLTTYMTFLSSIRREIVRATVAELKAVGSAENKLLIVYGVIAAVVILVMVFITSCVRDTTDRIGKYARAMEVKLKELSRERKRCESLMYRLMPPGVAEHFKKDSATLAEAYVSVTVAACDIDGFSVLITRSTPQQVVYLLSQVYRLFDEVLDLYDVYKVDTLGSIHILVCGLPVPNGKKHARDMALLSLELMQSFQSYRVPRMPSEKFALRVGLHSGECVAGVIAMKVPRYCLVGEALSTACRMEATGKANQIHITSALNQILDQVGNFTVEQCEDVGGTGKGDATADTRTYWLKRYTPPLCNDYGEEQEDNVSNEHEADRRHAQCSITIDLVD